MTSSSLGCLVKEEFNYAREIRSDRNACRTAIDCEGTKIKLEFVSFDNYDLTSCVDLAKFPIPFLDQSSCFYTKLLANADRKLVAPHKDLFDILAMYKEWRSIPSEAIKLAESHYGETVIIPSLIEALNAIIKKPTEYEKVTNILKMKNELVHEIVYEVPHRLLSELKSY